MRFSAIQKSLGQAEARLGLRAEGLGFRVSCLTPRLTIAQKPSIVWSLGPRASTLWSLEP